MPIHDWTRVDAGLFHDFHQAWTVALRGALNGGILPPDYYALIEQHVRGPVPDVLTLKLADGGAGGPSPALDSIEPGIAVAAQPPKARAIRGKRVDPYVARANKVTVRHRHGDVVAMIEIVSPGNKASRAEFRSFRDKAVALIRQQIHLMIVDVFPPTPRDPLGVQGAIWRELTDEDSEPLADDEPLLIASYNAGPEQVAYLEPVAVGRTLPEMPLFLTTETYVLAPLEKTYAEARDSFPRQLKGLLG